MTQQAVANRAELEAEAQLRIIRTLKKLDRTAAERAVENIQKLIAIDKQVPGSVFKLSNNGDNESAALRNRDLTEAD